MVLTSQPIRKYDNSAIYFRHWARLLLQTGLRRVNFFLLYLLVTFTSLRGVFSKTNGFILDNAEDVSSSRVEFLKPFNVIKNSAVSFEMLEVCNVNGRVTRRECRSYFLSFALAYPAVPRLVYVGEFSYTT